jgi:hypothetical protein
MFVGFCTQVSLPLYFGDFIKSVSKKVKRKTLPLPYRTGDLTGTYRTLPKKKRRKAC